MLRRGTVAYTGADHFGRDREVDEHGDQAVKVLHVASGDLWAGAEVQIYGLIKTLAREPAVAVSAVLLNEGTLADRLRAEGVETMVLDEQKMPAPMIWMALLRLLRQLKPDIVHTHRRKENVLGAAAASVSGALSVRTVHGALEAFPPFWMLHKHLYLGLDHAVARLQKRIIAVSTELAERIAPSFGSERVVVIPNGVDMSSLSEYRASLGIRKARAAPCIAFVGRLVPVKRVDRYLQAIAAVRNRGLDIQGLVIGDGPLHEQCEAAIAQLGLSEHVTWLGFVPDAPARIAEADALLMTSDHEGMPMTLLEAMAVGTPVIATAVGGIPEVLEYGECGVLVEHADPEALADALVALLGDEARKRRLTARAYARVKGLYSAAICAQRHAALYRELLGRAEGPAGGYAFRA